VVDIAILDGQFGRINYRIRAVEKRVFSEWSHRGEGGRLPRAGHQGAVVEGAPLLSFATAGSEVDRILASL
jgi:hypothetical protein